MSLSLHACFSEVSESQAQAPTSLSLPPLPPPLPPFLWLWSVSHVSRHEWHFPIQHRLLRPASPTCQAILMDNELQSTMLIFTLFLKGAWSFRAFWLEKKVLLFIGR